MTPELANEIYWHAMLLVGVPFFGAGCGLGWVKALFAMPDDDDTPHTQRTR